MNIVFGQITQFYEDPTEADYDGWLGLANIKGDFPAKNFVQVLYENGQIPNPSFSIYLGKSGKINRLVLGGVNPKYNTS